MRGLSACLTEPRKSAQELRYATLTTRSDEDVGKILIETKRSTTSGWLVECRTTAGSHFHGLLLFGTSQEADVFAHRLAAACGLAAAGQKLKTVGANRDGDWLSLPPPTLDQHVGRIVAYSLKLNKHASARTAEVPIAAFEWSDFEPARGLADFALDPGATTLARVRECACGCGRYLTGRTDRLVFGAACRVRMFRARKRARKDRTR